MASRNTNAVPYPDDGVCPTPHQFISTYRASYKHWTSLISRVRQDPSISSISKSLLDLLKRIPAFNAQPLRSFRILDGPCPLISCTFEWVTSIDPTCDRPVKRMYHHLKIAIPEPVKCNLISSPVAHARWSHLEGKDHRYLSYLVFGWAYLLASRWVETLLISGEEAFLRQSEEIDSYNFWDVVACRPWQAGVVREGKVFNAPWSLINDSSNSPYVFIALFTH